MTKDPSSTKAPRSTKGPSTKRPRSRTRPTTAFTRVVALAIPWTCIQAVRRLPKGSPSRSRCSGRVMRLDRRSTRTASRSPGTNQHSRWPGRRECQRIRRNAVPRLTKDLRKTSSGRSQTHPGHASSPEPPRDSMLVRRGSQAASRRHRTPSSSSLRNHRSRRSRCRDQLLRRPPHGPREADPAREARLCLPRKEKPPHAARSPSDQRWRYRIPMTLMMLQGPRRRRRVQRSTGCRSWTSRQEIQRVLVELRSLPSQVGQPPGRGVQALEWQPNKPLRLVPMRPAKRVSRRLRERRPGKWTCGMHRRLLREAMFHVKHLQAVVKGWSRNVRTRPSRMRRPLRFVRPRRGRQ